MEAEDRGHGVGIVGDGSLKRPEIEPAAQPRVRPIHLVAGQPERLFRRRRFIDGLDACCVRPETQAQQLCVHVGALEMAADPAQLGANAGDALAQRAAAARILGTGQQRLQEVTIGVQAVHPGAVVRRAVQKGAMSGQGKLERPGEGLTVTGAARQPVQLQPGQRRLQLIAAAGAGPAAVPRRGLLGGQPEDRMDVGAVDEIPLHRFRAGLRDVHVAARSGSPPQTQQAAGDDAVVEEVCQGLGAVCGPLERHRRAGCVPGPAQEIARPSGCIQIAAVPASGVQLEQRR